MGGRNMFHTTLDHLYIGQRCQVLRLRGTKSLRKRLIEMGLTPGVQVTVKKFAPLGDPIQLKVRGYALAVSRDVAQRIEVRILLSNLEKQPNRWR